MRIRTTILMPLLLLAFGLPTTPGRADDLNDGIVTDDYIQQYDDLGGSTRNFSYLSQRARSKARSGTGDMVLSDAGALNSVIMEAGAQINGDIIIIDDSKGDKTVIAH